MKGSLLLLILFFGYFIHAQNKKFLEHIYSSPDYYYIYDQTATNQRIELLNANPDYLSGLFIQALKKERIRRFRPDLEQDSLLNRIARSSIETYNKTRFVYSKTWRQEKKSFRYALIHEESDHKLYSAHAFSIDMLDLKFAESFYYDPKPGTSSVNLYFGKKPEIRNTEDPDYVEPFPIQPVTEEIACQRLIQLLSKGNYKHDLLSKKFSRIGLAIKIDQSSVNRNERPRIFVILIFGGKQLQTIKVRTEMLNDNYDKLDEDQDL